MKKSALFLILGVAFLIASANGAVAQETAYNATISTRSVWIALDSVDVVMNLETNNLYVTIGGEGSQLTEIARPAFICTPSTGVYMARANNYLVFADTRRGEVRVMRLTETGITTANIADLTTY